MKRIYTKWICLFIFIIVIPKVSVGYALLSHEAIIDACWEESIQPLLKAKYPKATAAQLKEAHAYVYGGSIVPDIGYYPMGSSMFTHLVHYVRTGDFINALLDEANDLNEYAFAVGVLCHYMADSYGHPLGTNRSVPVLFPKLKKKYGDVVTYEQGKDEHIRTEFSFDVLQTARGNYKPDQYNDFIGFQISESVLSRAFEKTYALKLDEVFGSLPAATAVFRFTVKNIFPELTKDAWKLHHSIIEQLNPLADKKNYKYEMDKKTYKKEFGKPKLHSTVVAFIIGILPKVGPLSRLKMIDTDQQVEKLYENSFRVITNNYEAAVVS